MDLHWRNTQKQARFFALDARAFMAIFLFLVHARLWTFVLAVVTMVVFWIFERRGLSFDSAMRSIRSWLAGRRRPGTLAARRRSWIDYG